MEKLVVRVRGLRARRYSANLQLIFKLQIQPVLYIFMEESLRHRHGPFPTAIKATLPVSLYFLQVSWISGTCLQRIKGKTCISSVVGWEEGWGLHQHLLFYLDRLLYLPPHSAYLHCLSLFLLTMPLLFT